MIQLLAFVLTIAPAFSQERFTQYCGHLAAPAPAPMRPNVKVGNLMDVVDATNGTDGKMKDAVNRGLDYEQFKAEMAAKQIKLSDQFHQANYELAARTRCEVTEGSPGPVSIQAHVSPTDAQLGRRVDDSGIGAPGTGDSDTTSGSSTTDR